MRPSSVTCHLTTVTSLLLLTACGFEPMAATDRQVGQGSLPREVATIAVNAIPQIPEQKLLAQQFRTRLEDLINPGGQLGQGKEYRLDVNLGTLISPGLIAPDGKAQRYIVNLQSDYRLTRIRDGKEISTGTVRRVGSYNNRPNAYFSTFVADQDTLKRLTSELAEEYRMRLASAMLNSDETRR